MIGQPLAFSLVRLSGCKPFPVLIGRLEAHRSPGPLRAVRRKPLAFHHWPLAVPPNCVIGVRLLLLRPVAATGRARPGMAGQPEPEPGGSVAEIPCCVRVRGKPFEHRG